MRASTFCRTSGQRKASYPRVLVPKTAVVSRTTALLFLSSRVTRLSSERSAPVKNPAMLYYVLDGLSGGESAATTGVDKLRDGDRVKVQVITGTASVRSQRASVFVLCTHCGQGRPTVAANRLRD